MRSSSAPGDADPESVTPNVSVVVATRDRPRRLAMLLDGLRQQSIGATRFELIVVDDGSAAETSEVLAAELERGSMDLRVLRHEAAVGPAAARDRGWRATAGAVIAFTDDDCVPDRRWLEAGLAAVASAPDAIVQGRTEPVPEELASAGPFSRTIEVTELEVGFQTCNIFYPREVLELVGGFDSDAFDLSPGGEDADLAWRAIEAGARPLFEPAALVHHAVNELGALGKLRVAGRWTTPMKAYVRHPELRRAHFVKGVFWKGSHYLLLRALLAVLLPRRLRWLAPWLVTPYLREVLTRRKRDRAGWWLLPYYPLHDLVECWAVIRAAVRYRHPMI